MLPNKLKPMRIGKSISPKIRRLLIILGPILITQIALSTMGFVDTMMSGRFSAHDLAGVAIGSSIWLPVYTGLSGILTALTPIIAQHAGAQRHDAIPHAVMQGVYLSIVITMIVMVIGSLVVQIILGLMQLEDNVRHIAAHYLIGLSIGILPLFFYTVLRCFIDALGQTRVTMMITLATLPINVGLNYMFIFGKAGLPAMGGIGAGYATGITYWIVAAIALVIVMRVRPFVSYRVIRRSIKPNISAWIEQLKIGIPIGISIFVEVSIFSAVALLMSRFGTIAIAAHQAAISFASLVYMVPLSISMALTIAVGYEVGAKRIRDAITYSRIGRAISVSMGLLIACVLLFFGDAVAGLYSTEPDVIQMTRSFLFYAIFFQLSDAIAAPIQGTLRGYKDVNAALVLSLISFWIVGLPVGYILAGFTSFGPYGYWIGLVTGLATGALGLLLRLRYTQNRFLGISQDISRPVAHATITQPEGQPLPRL